jgi:hypothetical protein
MVTRKDQAGVAGGLVYRHRDGTQARIENGGQKAAFAWLDDVAIRDRLAFRGGTAQNGAGHILDGALALNDVAVGKGDIRPFLPAHAIRLDELASAQALGGDEHALASRFGGNLRLYLGPVRPGLQPVSGDQRACHGSHQRNDR